MSRRRKNKAQKAISEIAYQLTMLVWVGVFIFIIMNRDIYGLLTAEFGDMNAILAAAVISTIAMFIAAAVIGLLSGEIIRRFVPKPDTTFDFSENPDGAKTPTDFEYEVAAIISTLTGNRAEVVGGSGDGGVDIKVFNGKKLVGVVQCKQLSPNKAVRPGYIRELKAVKHYHHVDKAYLVSTGYFTPKSINLAKELGVSIIDGERLQKMRRKVRQMPANVGV